MILCGYISPKGKHCVERAKFTFEFDISPLRVAQQYSCTEHLGAQLKRHNLKKSTVFATRDDAERE